MSTDATNDDGTSFEVPPVATDRPFVDGRHHASTELRDDVDKLSDDRRAHVEELRADVGDTVAELAARLDVPARIQAQKDRTTDEARAWVDRAVAAARDNPAAAVGGAVLLVVLLVRRAVRRSRRTAP